MQSILTPVFVDYSIKCLNEYEENFIDKLSKFNFFLLACTLFLIFTLHLLLLQIKCSTL